NQLIGINGQVTSVLAPKRSFSRAILQEVAGHPVVAPRAREVFNLLAEITSVRFGAAFSGGTDQHDRKARIKRHGHECSLAKTRHSFNAGTLCVYGFIGFEIVETTRGTPSPRPQRTPIVGFARLALVGQTDDAFRQARA